MNIVFDIGGTNMRIAGADGVMLGAVRKVPTPQDLDATIAQFAEIARDIAGSDPIEHAAGCIAGQIDTEKGIYDANNRPSWNGRHFDTELGVALGAPVTVANDCAVIGLGEYEYGAGKGATCLAYVTVSTGVGAALVKNGAIAPTPGFHFGHEMIDGAELETLISGTAVKNKFGIEPKDLESLDERNKLADIFAQGLVKIIKAWNPDTIVIGGSMIVGQNPIPLERVEKTLEKIIGKTPRIKMAALGDTGGLYGGMLLASRK